MPSVQAEEAGPVLFLDLARPPRNVLDLATIHELAARLAPLADRRDIRTVVLRSGVPGIFSAGVDVSDHRQPKVDEMLTSFHAVFRRLDELPQVTVAAVDGPCLGGGCELAAFCDIILATRRAVFGLPEVDLGCFPPVAAAFLPRLLGRPAFELVLTGRRVDADEAQRIGLVTRVVDDLPAEVDGLVATLSAKSGVALAAARRALRLSCAAGFAEALAAGERLYREQVAPSNDAEEGILAFLQKRPPVWTHS